jgi:hypothetical protein
MDRSTTQLLKCGSRVIADPGRILRGSWPSVCRSVCGLVLALLVASCTTHSSVFYSLTNQGIVPVSADNPHLGANVFLASEMEASSYLYSFMKSRGAPQAIEVLGPSEESAELRMFYADKNETYRATPQFDPRNKTKEWIVRGPYGLDRENYHTLSQLKNQRGGAFEIFGRLEVLGGPAVANTSRVIAPAFVPTPRPTPRPAPRVKKESAPTTTISGSNTNLPFTGSPSNLDQEALVEALKQKASETPIVPTPAAQGSKAPSVRDKAATSAPVDGALKDAAKSASTAPLSATAQPIKPSGK